MNIGWGDVTYSGSAYRVTAYGRAAARSVGAKWQPIVSPDGRWQVPLCISDLNGAHVDAASPYGYAGIHVDASLSADEIRVAWGQTRKLLRERGVVSVFFRFAPYRPGIEEQGVLSDLDVRPMSETVMVPIADEAVMWAAMQGRARTAVRKAEREGLVADVEPAGVDLLIGEMSGFRRVYDAAMERVSASSIHRHDDFYYRTLAESNELTMQLVSVRDRDGGVVAACLLLVDDHAVHYHLSGSYQEAARLGANNLLLWSAMKWSFAHGHSHLHLGGGTAQNDSLFRFKASFGGERLPFNVGRLVVDPDAYEALVTERAAKSRVSREDLLASEFFPAYRTPLP